MAVGIEVAQVAAARLAAEAGGERPARALKRHALI
jgi:hypothetical protein